LRQQKCTDPAKFCDACNGFGVIVTAPNLGGMAEMKALIDAGFGDKSIETAEVECKRCLGTGRRMLLKP
jgi:DnaJ-class molecular chaperone